MKNTYKIVHREELVGWFFVEAESEEEALEKYHHQVNNGRVDFSDLEMVDSSDIAELAEENELTSGLWIDDSKEE